MTEEKKEEMLQEIFEYYGTLGEPCEQETLVALLREVQEVYGAIPWDIQQRIAEKMEIKLSLITSIIKLYPTLKSIQRHTITLCTGPRCTARESQALGDELHRELQNLRKNKKASFVLTTKNCMKECRTAPNLKIDGKLYPHIKPGEITEILKTHVEY